jgi:hypothetical protein
MGAGTDAELVEATAGPATRRHHHAASGREATMGVRLAAPTDDHLALMYSRMIA